MIKHTNNFRYLTFNPLKLKKQEYCSSSAFFQKWCAILCSYRTENYEEFKNLSKNMESSKQFFLSNFVLVVAIKI